ncbi:MAG: hypothetical protein HW380_1380 [Magnetococcales bacterium]|nr:hypothetical protein [Magnetococcales bacterium]
MINVKTVCLIGQLGKAWLRLYYLRYFMCEGMMSARDKKNGIGFQGRQYKLGS